MEQSDLVLAKNGAFPTHVEISECCQQGEGLDRVMAIAHYTKYGNNSLAVRIKTWLATTTSGDPKRHMPHRAMD